MVTQKVEGEEGTNMFKCLVVCKCSNVNSRNWDLKRLTEILNVEINVEMINLEGGEEIAGEGRIKKLRMPSLHT